MLDFGIAKVLLDETAFNSITKTGELFGSPYYMSPEQCVGKAIDTRSDIYSLGCVMFEALTGVPPFLSDNPLTTMMKHQAMSPPSLKEGTLGHEFPADLENIVAGMLAKNVDERYQNLLLVEHDLRLLKRGERLQSYDKTTRSSPAPILFGVLAAGMGAVIIAGGATYFMLGSNSTEPPKQSSPVLKLHAFDSTPFIDLAGMSKPTSSVTTKFFSDSAGAQAKRRHFHFPAKAIGTIGSGESEDSFVPAVGEMVRDVPFSFVAGQNVGALSGFRPDEIDYLMMRGPVIDDFSTKLIRNWQVTNLNLEWSDVDDRAIENIRTLSKLKSLNVSNTHISASGLSKLRLDRLQFLGASQIAYLVPVLAQMKTSQLRTLNLRDAELKDSDMKDLARFHDLEVLDLASNEITDKGIAALSTLQHLSQLWIGENNVSPKCISSLKKMSNLHGVTLSMTNWTPQEKAEFLQSASKSHFSVSVVQNHLSKAATKALSPNKP